MFNWLKPKAKPAQTAPATQSTAAKPSRDDLIKDATSNMQAARDAIGPEALARLNAIIQKKKAEEEVSPAAQARKILQQMDKGHLADFLKALDKGESPTKH